MLFTKQSRVKNARFQYVKDRDRRPVISVEFRHKKNNFFTYSQSHVKDEKLGEYNERMSDRRNRAERNLEKVRRLRDPRFKVVERMLLNKLKMFKLKKLPERCILLGQYSAGFIPGYGDKNSKRQKIKHVCEQLAELQAARVLDYFNERLPTLYLRNRRMYFSTKKIVKVARMFNILKTYKQFKARNKPNTYFKLLYPRNKFKYSKKFSRMAFFDYIYYKNYRHVK